MNAVAETCSNCGLSLDVAHEQPAGYVHERTDGSVLCGGCADRKFGWNEVDGRVPKEQGR